MVVMTAEKPLLVRTTPVSRPAILALATFTVMLTLVDPIVGVLPILLLATVMTPFRCRKDLMTPSPRLGVMCVHMDILDAVPLSVVLLGSRLSRLLARVPLLPVTTLRLEVTWVVASGRLLATTIAWTLV